MRISTTQLYTDATRNMLEGQSKLAEIQSKISSGKNFTTLAEDPVGASHVVNLKREMAQFDMYQSNVDATRRRLSLEETTLADINTALDRVRELTIQAGNGVLTNADRQAISFEFDELVGYVAGLMNTRDAKGEYLFSGSLGKVQAFQLEAGRYAYAGDSANREIQVAPGVFVDSTDSGRAIFQALKGDSTISATGFDTATSFSFDVTDQDAYERFVRTNGDLSVVTNTASGTFSIVGGGGVSLTDLNGDTILDRPYTPGSEVVVEVDGATLTFNFGGVSDEYGQLTYRREDTNVLNAILDTQDALLTNVDGDPAANTAFQDQLSKMLDQLTEAQARITETRASLGARLNSLDKVEFSNQDFKLLTESTLSAVEDLDYASASTELAKRQLALEASFASFAKIQGLSLFNYLN